LPYNQTGKVGGTIGFFPQTVKGLLMHVFWLEQDRIHEVVAGTQSPPYFSGLPHQPVSCILLLAAIGKIIAMTAAIIFAAINNSYASVTFWAEKPLSPASIVARCPGKEYSIFNTLPFTIPVLVLVLKDKSIILNTIPNIAGFFTTTLP
jgi:hypothetical protein